MTSRCTICGRTIDREAALVDLCAECSDVYERGADDGKLPSVAPLSAMAWAARRARLSKTKRGYSNDPGHRWAEIEVLDAALSHFESCGGWCGCEVCRLLRDTPTSRVEGFAASRKSRNRITKSGRRKNQGAH